MWAGVYLPPYCQVCLYHHIIQQSLQQVGAICCESNLRVDQTHYWRVRRQECDSTGDSEIPERRTAQIIQKYSTEMRTEVYTSSDKITSLHPDATISQGSTESSAAKRFTDAKLSCIPVAREQNCKESLHRSYGSRSRTTDCIYMRPEPDELTPYRLACYYYYLHVRVRVDQCSTSSLVLKRGTLNHSSAGK